MLRDLIVTTLLALSVLVFFADQTANALLLLIAALTFIALGNKAGHILEKKLNYLASRLARALAAIVLLGVVSLLLSTDKETAITYASLFAVASLPLGIPLAIRGHFAMSETAKALHNAIKIIRSVLASNIAFIGVIAFAVSGTALFDIQMPVSIAQLLLVALLLALPLSKLKSDPPRGKTLKVTAHNLYAHTLSAQNLPHYLKSGVLASALAYTSYLVLFELNNLSPRSVDTLLPLHIEAATLVSMTLLLCLFANILFERQEHHSVFSFEHFTQRAGMLRSMGLAILLFVIMTSLPGLRSLFDASALGILSWAVAIVLTGIYVGLRRLQRYMREHTRGAVIDLHRSL